MKKTGVAIIHGMGNQNRDFADKFIKEIKAAMKIQMKGSTDLLIFISNRFTGLMY